MKLLKLCLYLYTEFLWLYLLFPLGKYLVVWFPDKHHYRKPQAIKMQSCGAHPK